MGISINCLGRASSLSDLAIFNAASSCLINVLSFVVRASFNLVLAALISAAFLRSRSGACFILTIPATRWPYIFFLMLTKPPTRIASVALKVAFSIIVVIVSAISSSFALNTDFPRVSSNSFMSFLLPRLKNFIPATVPPIISGTARITCSVVLASGRQ